MNKESITNTKATNLMIKECSNVNNKPNSRIIVLNHQIIKPRSKDNETANNQLTNDNVTTDAYQFNNQKKSKTNYDSRIIQ